jgi:hypothetical protein
MYMHVRAHKQNGGREGKQIYKALLLALAPPREQH